MNRPSDMLVAASILDANRHQSPAQTQADLIAYRDQLLAQSVLGGVEMNRLAFLMRTLPVRA